MPTCQGRLKGAHEQMKGDHSWGWCGSEGSTKHGMHGSLDLIRPASFWFADYFVLSSQGLGSLLN